MRIENDNQGLSSSNAAICPGTAIRKEACVCGTCGLHASSHAKWATNRRDALALLYLAADYVTYYKVDRASWDDVTHAANFRRRLMDIAVNMHASLNMDEQTARRRLEEALGAEDEDLDEALLDAL